MITEGYIARHYQGQPAGRGPALIDIAQDHLLHHLAKSGLMDLGLVLKGGTAIRKLRAGNAGRFSTDLDFAGLTDDFAELLLEEIHGAVVGQFRFSVEPLNGNLRATLRIDSEFGSPDIPARLDLGRRAIWLPAEKLPPIALPIHRRYEFTMPPIATPRIEEVIGEKLARYRRTRLARDLYDLAWFAGRPFDEELVRRITVLKVWVDVNEDGLGTAPFVPGDVLSPRRAEDFDPEAIGYLTTPVDLDRWIRSVGSRYGFLEHLDDFEIQVSTCSKADRWAVQQAIGNLGSSTR